ncbi:MAG: NfeD family protein [Oscillospiraceae bacterium]
MAFGERLQEVRRRAGLTQEQFAAELNVSRQAVSKWESCRGYPEIEKILYICNRYQVSLDELFSQEVPRQAPAQPAPDTPPLPEKTLALALSAFFANLSPREKWLGLGAVAGTLALALALGLCLKGGTTDMMTIIWIAAMVIFGVVEAVTVGLASIWFVVGSVAGLIAAICGGPVWLQIALFFVVSIVCLAATRPLVKKLLHKDVTATNADRVLGQTARVTESIDNAVPTGAVYVGGMTWTARSESGQPIPRNAQVKIVRMEGVRLFVEPV